MDKIDIRVNRELRKYSRGEILARILWFWGGFLFRWSPRFCWSWRNWLLRIFGAKIGAHVRIANTARIQYPWLLSLGDFSAIGDYAIIYNLGQINCGSRVTVSQYAHLCGGSHDYQSNAMDLIRATIEIGDYAWVCADAFIGPNVTIGDGAVVGARAVVMKSVEPWTVVVGNPAREVKKRVMRDGTI